MFSPQGPTLRELGVQALSSVPRGYDLLAPKFDHTPFRTPPALLEATTTALAALGPFDRGLDVCCGTGAGVDVLRPLCRESITGVDFSAGMLDQARAAHQDARWVRADARALPFTGGFDLAVTFGALGHFLPGELPDLFSGVRRALRPGGILAFPIVGPPSPASPWYWLTLGFDVTMRIRNALWHPPFVMYYRTGPLPVLRHALRTAGFTVELRPLPAPAAGCHLLVATSP
ncbi:class I SAM-dependent DNA methyltransferase [Actinoplanes rectilineatus]|uniref:class I SAM-dependent DNA methyltransferase n=1 Tax=Actinoplanes rectilineatus TaxID=113571 RepID=UPI0005F287CF|nr:class I SAM-dependent methyltransferase [Actinoplanes rectilineatus]